MVQLCQLFLGQFWLAPVYFSFLFFLGSCVPQLEGPPRLRDHRAQKWRTQAKTPFGATPTVPQRLPQALVALVRLPNYLMASCSLLRFVRLTSAQVATWISAAPVAPCRFICCSVVCPATRLRRHLFYISSSILYLLSSIFYLLSSTF